MVMAPLPIVKPVVPTGYHQVYLEKRTDSWTVRKAAHRGGEWGKGE